MAKSEDRSKIVTIKELLARDEDFVRSAVQGFVQAALEAEMTETFAAGKYERTDGRLALQLHFECGSEPMGHYGRRSWMMGASVEATLELFASSLRDVKALIRLCIWTILWRPRKAVWRDSESYHRYFNFI